MEVIKDIPKFSIVIPAYNEEETILSVIQGIRRIEQVQEIIVVDDGSTDRTCELLQEIGVKLIRHPYNKGYGAALKSGIKASTSEIILVMDADGQHRSEEILRVVEEAGNFDMVVASRTDFSYRPLYLRLGISIVTKLLNCLVMKKIPDWNSGFRTIKRELVREFIHFLPDTFSFTTSITLAAIMKGYKVKYIPVKINKRSGKSKVSIKGIFQSLIAISKMILWLSPLKVFLPLLFISLTSGFYLIYGRILLKGLSVIAIITLVFTLIFSLLGVLATLKIHVLRRESAQS